jgi:hypothetical protein
MGVQKAAKKMPTAVDGNPDNGLISLVGVETGRVDLEPRTMSSRMRGGRHQFRCPVHDQGNMSAREGGPAQKSVMPMPEAGKYKSHRGHSCHPGGEPKPLRPICCWD